MGALCNAQIDGLEIGSHTLTFTPSSLQPDCYKYDIGTAGSIVLVFQACILSAFHTSNPITLTLIGGTDVKWSPSWDYFTQVYLPLLNRMGIHIETTLEQRGYYPKGGGKATITIHPTTKIQSLTLSQPQVFTEIRGRINIANLPDHIASRMKHAVLKLAVKQDYQTHIDIEETSSLSSGTGITLWASNENTTVGTTVLGERGISAESVGETAITQLLQYIQTGATIDSYGIDQILPFLVLAQKPSVCRIRKLSNHTQTNMWLLQQFTNAQFECREEQDIIQLNVQ
jgi:RNA 3'-phosphate cyclase